MVQIIRRSAYDPFHQLQTEMNRLFGGFLPSAGGASAESGVRADLDLRETDTEVVVRAEVPGLDPKDLDVRVTGDVLTIEGEKRDERTEEREGWHVTERQFGSVRRQIRLPADVDASQVSAEARNGVLTVRLPKTQAEQPRKIPVQAD